MESIVYFVFLLCFCDIFGLSTGELDFRLDDPHVCNNSYVTTRSIKIPVIGPCKKKKGLCRRIETKIEFVGHKGCCEGFFFNGSVCVPEMKTICSLGNRLINETHCAPDCLPGFFNDLTDANLACKSKCDQPCINATCTDFGTCTCFQGYTEANQYKCEPFCVTCINGTCEEPGKCVCLPGHEEEEVGVCKPVCGKCNNGTCIGPGVCQCEDEYYLEDGECKPVCYECEHGTCVAPQECHCDDEYKLDESDRCAPVCEKCDHGICVGPDECICDGGYLLDEETGNCTPVCKDDCVNSVCESPNSCKCYSGFEKSNTSNVCAPICDFCYGECVSPGVCIFSINCKECEGTCNEGICACSNGTACEVMNEEAAGVESTPTLAAVQVTWISAVGVLFLLLVIIVAVIWHMYRRNTYDRKANGVETNEQGSVAYTVSNTLMPPAEREYQDEYIDDMEPRRQNEIGLLPTTYSVRL